MQGPVVKSDPSSGHLRGLRNYLRPGNIILGHVVSTRGRIVFGLLAFQEAPKMSLLETSPDPCLNLNC